MDPQLSGFALGLLLGAAKIGFIGTLAFGVAWWRARKRLLTYERGLPDPGRLEERLASLEQSSDYVAGKLTDLLENQNAILRQLGTGAGRPVLPEHVRPADPDRPHTPH